MQVLSGGRFRLGLGSGENLDEHVVGAGWPAAPVRLDEPAEATGIIRALFRGGEVTHHATHFDVARAGLWDLPEDIAETFPCGDDVGRFVEAVRASVDAGFTEVSLVRIGGAHQEPFPEWAEAEPLPALRTL